ncbi:MAG: methyltransferase [Hyphomicrobiaceae bacterium]|nr:methyltransferase [Hyphomicrobiaceae bacterium]
MAWTYVGIQRQSVSRRHCGMVYAWGGFAVMWAFWACFIVFLASPPWAAQHWPLPTVDTGGAGFGPVAAALIDLGLVSLFGLQHSIMARPAFKAKIMSGMPSAFERCTYVHAANIALLAVIVFWQPIPVEIWTLSGLSRSLAWIAFVAGWLVLLGGAWSFGMLDLLGIEQMRAWCRAVPAPVERLRTRRLFRWLPHPMYIGIVLAIWSTPRMTLGHLLIAVAMTVYVLIAVRYEERDLSARFGRAYALWRSGQLRRSR